MKASSILATFICYSDHQTVIGATEIPLMPTPLFLMFVELLS